MEWLKRRYSLWKINRYVRARDKAMEDGDLSFVHRHHPKKISDADAWVMFHKTRIHCVNVSEEKRAASREWLRVQYPPKPPKVIN